MVHVLCTRFYSAIEVKRSQEVYANLRSILLHLEVEQSQDNRAKKNKNLYLPSKINFDRFLREGMGYVAMINNLNSWIMPNSVKNMVLLKTINVLERVQFQYKGMRRMRNLLLAGKIPFDIREDIIISLDNVIPENNEPRVGFAEYDLDEYEIIEFYDWQSEWKTRNRFMELINLLISKIYTLIVRRRLTQYSMLKKYCKRATIFLHRNRKILKSNKLRRSHKRNLCCEYHFLKQFIACCHHVLPRLIK